MKQPELLAQLNVTIKNALSMMLKRDLVTDPAFAKRILQDNNLPYRKLQALMLTSDAFLAMSVPDAANVMGIETHSVEQLLWELRTQYPHLASFEDAWKAPATMQCIDNVDEMTIVQRF